MKVIEIDGSVGEGGGQILRTSLSLSMLTGKPFRMTKIRAGRVKPGLGNQHLTSVEASQRISNAYTEGVKKGSQTVYFEPQGVQSGIYEFDIGTAGSTTLVLQTLLPALMLQEKKSTLRIRGGTHNGMSPPVEFLQKTFLPQLQKMGVEVETDVSRLGFFPKGGGCVDVQIYPTSKLKELSLCEAKEKVALKIQSLSLNLPHEVAEKEIEYCLDTLKLSPLYGGSIQAANGIGQGNVIQAFLSTEHGIETITEYGKRGLYYKDLCDSLLGKIKQYTNHPAPVGEYLADQLLLPMTLCGEGSFWCTEISPHTQTNMDTIQKFLDVVFEVEEFKNGWNVRVVSKIE